MLRIGLIGYGRRGRVLQGLLRELTDVAVVAIGDIDAAAQQRARAETGLPVFHPWLESWPNGPPDVVVLATPAKDRAPLVAHVVQPGVRALLTEKPVAFTLGECDEIDRLCTATGATASVAHHWRYCPALRRLQALVAKGRLGTIESVHATGYGNLLDQGCHLLDAICWVLGGPTVQWAAAQGTSDRETLARLGGAEAAIAFDPQHPAPVWTTAELALTGNVRVRLELGPLLQQTGAPLGVWHERRFRIQGTRGSAECRPGHYLRLQIPGDDADDTVLHPASLDVATKSLLQAVCDAARHGAPAPLPLADARHTLEGLLLCGASLRDGSVAAAPLAAADDPYRVVASERRFAATPLRSRAACESAVRFSVVIPLLDERGFGQQCLQRWLTQEQFSSAAYELLVIDDGTATLSRDQFRSQLRPQDQWLECDARNRSAQYNLGAQAALGEFLIITESHCVPEPDFLCELDRYLQRFDVDGACVRSIPVCYNALARADATSFEDGYRQFCREGDWRKVNVHGFALRRDLYQQVGGLQARYDAYAEMVLAADLRDAGVRLGYCAGAAVQHHYRVTLSQLVDYFDSFVRGELQYRADHGDTERIGFSYLNMGPIHLESRPARRACLRLEWERFKHNARQADFSSAGTLWQLLREDVRDRGIGRWLAQWQRRGAALACWAARHNQTRLLPAFQRLVQATIVEAWERLRHEPTLPTDAKLQVSWTLADWPADRLYGFYPAETTEGRAFRWSRPVAGLDLLLPAGQQEIQIETGRIRPWPGSLHWTLCGRPIPAADIHYEDDRCCLIVTVPKRPAGTRRTLGLSCLPWDVVTRRPLGLPIFAITTRPAEAGRFSESGQTLQHHSQPARSAA